MCDDFWLEEKQQGHFRVFGDIIRGETGPHYTPAVDENGNLSWTNNGNLPNPETVNIKGDKGDPGDVTAEQMEEAIETALEPYRTAAAQDTIDAAQDERIDAAAQATESTTIGPAPIVTFDASAADMPLKGLTVNIEPVQSGSGDPSPENVRPITGWTGCKLLKMGQNLCCDVEYTDGTTAGVQYTKLPDGSYLATGTITAKYAKYLIDGHWGRAFKPGKYQVSCDGVSYDGIRLVAAYVKGYGQPMRYIDITGPNAKYVFEIEPAGYIYSIYFRGETTGTQVNTVLKPLLMFQANTETEWVPYFGGTYSITFPAEAGTVYGGTLDVVNKKLTVDKGVMTINENSSISVDNSGFYVRNDDVMRLSDYSNAISSNRLKTVSNHITLRNEEEGISAYSHATVLLGQNWIYFKPGNPEITTVEGVKAWLTDNPIKVLYLLATPIVYDLTDIPEILTLYGTNNIWADCGDVTVTYGAYLETVKAHAERLGDSILSAIAPLEASYTASRTYAVGSYLFVGTKFYKVTRAIAEGGTITPGTNAVQTTVAEQLIALAAG